MAPAGSRPRAVIFDFDGVILESTEIKTAAFLELFAEYPQHHSAILEHHRKNLGISRFSKFAWIHENLLHRPLTDEESQHLGRRFSSLVVDRTLQCAMVEGALELLRDLRGRSLAFVASGTPQEELDLIVDRRGLRPLFDGIAGTPARKPEIIRRLLGEHSLTADETLLVGDGISDLRAARETGIAFVGRLVPDQPDSFEGLDVPRIRNLHELRPLVGLRPTGGGSAASD